MGRLIEWTSSRAFWRDDRNDLFFGVVDVFERSAESLGYVPYCTIYLPPKPVDAGPRDLYIPPTGWALINETMDGVLAYEHDKSKLGPGLVLPAWEAFALSEEITRRFLTFSGDVFAYKRFDF